jgi:hypothetical protein
VRQYGALAKVGEVVDELRVGPDEAPHEISADGIADQTERRRELLAIVWTETYGLSPKDGNDQTRAHLQAVVTNLAAVAKQRGFGYKLAKRLAPRSDNDPETAAYSALRATANAVADTKWVPQIALPARAVLWEINDNGAPRRDPALPASAAWIYESEATAAGFLSEVSRRSGAGEPLTSRATSGSAVSQDLISKAKLYPG